MRCASYITQIPTAAFRASSTTVNPTLSTPSSPTLFPTPNTLGSASPPVQSAKMSVTYPSSAVGTKLARRWTVQSFLYLSLFTFFCRGSVVRIEAEIVDNSIIHAEDTVSTVSPPLTLVPTLVPTLACKQGPEYQQCRMRCTCYSNGQKTCENAPDKCATDCNCENRANSQPAENTYQTLATTAMTCNTENAFGLCKDKCSCKAKNGHNVLFCLNAPAVCAEQCTCPQDDFTINPSIALDFPDPEALEHPDGRSMSIDAPKDFLDMPQQALAKYWHVTCPKPKDLPSKCPLACYYCNGATQQYTPINQDPKTYPNVGCKQRCDEYFQDGRPWGKCVCQNS